MADKDKIVGMLERLISQIPIVGGVPEGEFRGRSSGWRSYGTEAGAPIAYDPEEIFFMLPTSIDFQKLPDIKNRQLQTARFALFYAQFDGDNESLREEMRKKQTNTYVSFLRLGFPQNPNEYSTADRSHLSLARCAAQEVFELYNSLARLDEITQPMDMNNLIFFGDGHGSDMWVRLLFKRLVVDTQNSYVFNLDTTDGGFVTYYPDGTLALGGESRHLSPLVPEAGYGDQARRVEITKKAHQRNLERAKKILETHFAQEGLERNVVIGEYKIINEQFGYAQVTKPE